MDARALLMYAFIKEKFEQTGDIVSGLIPLFAPIVKQNAHSDFDSVQFSKSVDQYYGIKMHPYVAQDWAPRLAAAGLLHAVGESHIERYINLDPELPDFANQEQRVNAIFHSFHTFCKPIVLKHGIAINDGDLDAALRRRLISMDFLDIMNAPDRNHMPDRTLRLDRRTETAGEVELGIEAKLDVICAAFALELYASDPTKFDMLGEVAAGALISEVVLGLRVPPKIDNDLSGTFVALDAPLVIDLLNIASEEEYDSVRFIVDELKKLNCHIVTYQHCMEELKAIINRVIDQHDNRMTLSGSVGRRTITDSNAMSRLRMLQRHVVSEVGSLGVAIVDPEEDLEKHKYFPKASIDDLVSKIRPYHNIDSRINDALSIAASIREMRSRKPVSNVFSVSHLFISKNAGLIRTAFATLVRDSIIDENQAPPFMTDRHLAGLLFIASGGVGVDVPVKKLIANCAAAVRPRQDVVTRLYKTLHDLDPAQAEEFSTLMSDRRCSFYLMEQSLGDANYADSSNALEVLEQIRAQTAYDIERKLKSDHADEIASKEESFDAERRERRRREGELNQKLGLATEEIAKLETTVGQLTEEKEIGERNTLARCMDKAENARIRVIVIIASVLAVLAVGGGLLASLGTTVSVSAGIGLSVVVTGLQFWVIPGWLFGGLVNKYRLRVFQNELQRVGASQLESQYDVDFDSGTIARRSTL